MYALARVVRLVTGVVVALIVAGILIHVLDANTSNVIVSAIDDAASTGASPPWSTGSSACCSRS